MSEKRFFTKINKNGINVIIDKECHIEISDLFLACEFLNRLDLKLKTYNEQLGEQQVTIQSLKEENEQLRKERDYWETSSKHRQRLLEDAEKELRLHNAYLVDKGYAEDYIRWKGAD